SYRLFRCRCLTESLGAGKENSAGDRRGYCRRGARRVEGAPAWVFDRSALWNAVETVERRKDAQLAREVEVGLPIELGNAEQEALLRDYVQREFIRKGMVADFSIHRDDENNPHAHVLLSLRSLEKRGFGPKERS